MYRHANLTQRAIALIIDSVILMVIGGALGIASRNGFLASTASFLVGLAYNWYFWTQNNGQTPGKMVMGIRVIKRGGGKLGDAEAVVRYVGYYINTAIFLLGWIWALLDEDSQGWHDKLAGTVVINA